MTGNACELPISAHRREITEALRKHPAIIVCGDTGSGKTTQLPRMALELGRDIRVACTQPRRLATVAMAERVAAEMQCEIGTLVGYSHRFAHRVSRDTRIEFLTDGTLLASVGRDPLLRRYDVIVIDEAHERSLNIDFLLGILKRILQRRRDLKVVISSATIDAGRFSEFFGGAPTISVPGRLYPIETIYRPPPESEERDLPMEISDAVSELPPDGDILVFLPGERDIRDAAEVLRDFHGNDDIIPLLASLPAAEQQRAFRPSSRRRIILATNVAETSVTIPGIRAVIDSGLARISRYLHRTRVQRLQIEPISQASARQRMGRCGRVGPGICIRLYSEEDYLSRDAYTPPEILRSSLAGVILTMLGQRLGDIDRFPFIEPPKPAMVREGLRELLELGAIRNGERGAELTETGRKLFRLPIEPRLARILIESSRNATLPSALPVVAAMACEDPRRRPIDEKAKADQCHARFRVDGSDFLGTLKLWKWWTDTTDSLSQSKQRKLCKENFLSYPKMREWRDVVRQTESLCRELKLDVTSDNGGADALHRSLIAGLLGRIGRYDEESHDYRGSHAVRFSLHPGSVLTKKPRERPAPKANRRPEAKRPTVPKWIVAGELVETTRLFARTAAAIDVRWIEPIAGSICKHSYHTPEWDERFGFVRATEQVTLYGLVIVPARRCDYSRIDPSLSREIFLRRGLIDGAFPNPPPEVRKNISLIDDLRQLAERARNPSLFDEDKILRHLDRAIPPEICSADALRKWLRSDRSAGTSFVLDRDQWIPKELPANRDFPDTMTIAGVKVSLEYRHSPEDPRHDGITCTLPRSAEHILALWHYDWLVPGMLPEKVSWMIGSLPSALRRTLSPLDETIAILLPMLRPGDISLEEAIRRAVRERWGFTVPPEAWSRQKLPEHLKMHFRFTGGAPVRENASSAAGWTFRDIPLVHADINNGWKTISYAALKDTGDGVTPVLLPRQDLAQATHRFGVTRLFTLALAGKTKIPALGKRFDRVTATYLNEIGYKSERISDDIVQGAICEALVRNRPEVRTESEYLARLNEDRSAIVRAQSEMLEILIESVRTASALGESLADERVPASTAESVMTQLAWMIFPGFLRTTPLEVLRHYRRYLKGVAIRIERARNSPPSDQRKQAQFDPYWQKYREALTSKDAINPFVLEEYRWMLEEYRISVFAPELHTAYPVSPKRLDEKLGKP